MGYRLEPCDGANCQLDSILNHLRNGPLALPMWDFLESISWCGEIFQLLETLFPGWDPGLHSRKRELSSSRHSLLCVRNRGFYKKKK